MTHCDYIANKNRDGNEAQYVQLDGNKHVPHNEKL